MKYKLTDNSTQFFQPTFSKDKCIAVDATNLVTGRLAAYIVSLMKGKLGTEYSPNARSGFKVVIYNCKDISLTGKKMSKKNYYFHSGFPGGFKTRTASTIAESKNPHLLIKLAIKRMMSNTPMHRKIYNFDIKYIEGSLPEGYASYNQLNFASLNSKNSIAASK
jgi:large subunit ribosomal protein L13